LIKAIVNAHNIQLKGKGRSGNGSKAKPARRRAINK